MKWSKLMKKSLRDRTGSHVSTTSQIKLAESSNDDKVLKKCLNQQKSQFPSNKTYLKNYPQHPSNPIYSIHITIPEIKPSIKIQGKNKHNTTRNFQFQPSDSNNNLKEEIP
jgi:hypothetical protein